MNNYFRVLLVEDSPDDVLLLKLAFKVAEFHHPLYVASDGQEAIEWLGGEGKFSDRKQYPLPCLILLDLKMPRKTGMDVLEWLRKRPILNCMPVIILSSSAHRYDVERAYTLGINAFVVKPAGNAERKEFANSIKDFWAKFNQPPLVCAEGLEEAQKVHSAENIPPSFF